MATDGELEELILFQDRHRLAACEAGLDFVPIRDGLFAQLPAEANIVSVVAADEIDQAHLIVFQIATDFVEFFDIVLQMFDGSVKLGLQDGLLLGLGAIEGSLQRGDLIVGLYDVRHNTTYQRERPIRLSQLESLGGPRGGY